MTATEPKSAPTAQAIEREPAVVVPLFSSMLQRLANEGKSSKLVYREIAERLVNQFQVTPTGAMLEDIVRGFNWQAGEKSLPLGTAGTAAEVVKDFRKIAATDIAGRFPLLSLNDSVREEAARMFDQVVTYLREEIALPYQSQLEKAHAQANEQMESLRNQLQAGFDERMSAMRAQLEDAESERDALKDKVHQCEEEMARSTVRISDLTGQLDDMARRLQAVSNESALLQNKLGQASGKLESTMSERDRSLEREHEIRKQLMLTNDKLRQVEGALEKSKAAQTHLREQVLASEKAQLEMGTELNELRTANGVFCGENKALKEQIASIQITQKAASKPSRRKTQ